MRIRTLRLSDELDDRLEQQAVKDHRSVNQQLIYIIERATDPATTTTEESN